MQKKVTRHLSKEDLLDNYTRGQIHGYLLGQKIAYYNKIKRDLKLNNGSAAHHLRVMEKAGIVSSVKKKMGLKQGRELRFYYIGKLPKGFSDDIFTEMECLIMSAVADDPGISQSKLARKLGISSSTVTYHTDKLKEHDYLKKERHGWYKLFFPKFEKEPVI